MFLVQINLNLDFGTCLLRFLVEVLLLGSAAGGVGRPLHEIDAGADASSLPRDDANLVAPFGGKGLLYAFNLEAEAQAIAGIADPCVGKYAGDLDGHAAIPAQPGTGRFNLAAEIAADRV